MLSATYDHRLKRIGHPVRSAIHKLQIGGLVVGWVTTSESPLLYVPFVFLASEEGDERGKGASLLYFLVALDDYLTKDKSNGPTVCFGIKEVFQRSYFCFSYARHQHPEVRDCVRKSLKLVFGRYLLHLDVPIFCHRKSRPTYWATHISSRILSSWYRPQQYRFHTVDLLIHLSACQSFCRRLSKADWQYINPEHF